MAGLVGWLGGSVGAAVLCCAARRAGGWLRVTLGSRLPSGGSDACVRWAGVKAPAMRWLPWMIRG